MIIHRKMDWAYGAVKFDIYIDGLLKGELGILKTKEFNLSTGEHEIGCGIDGDITYDKIFINEQDNITLGCRISPIIDIFYIPLILNPFIYFLFNKHNYNLQPFLLLQLLFLATQLIVFIVLSYKHMLIKIKKL
jgi:hypothetical protein